MDGPLRGVNLGGWLVFEKWIAPSLFEGTGATDEYRFFEHPSTDDLKRVAAFRDSWITQDDFTWLAEQGVQVVRLPFGHWLFGDDPRYRKLIGYVDKAFSWAEEAGIRILLDFHGARGSQNGRQHSGHIGSIDWHRDGLNIAHTLEVIEKLARRYGKSPALLGISLLNEPFPSIPSSTLESFYKKAYHIIRDICGEETWVVYSDGYQPNRWRKALPRDEFVNVYIDTHHYQIYTRLDRMLPLRLQVWRARWQLPRKLKRLAKYHPVIIGEWSLALPGERLKKLNSRQRTALSHAYGAAQLKAFGGTAAWFYWTYKTEYGGSWNFRDCVEKGSLDIT